MYTRTCQTCGTEFESDNIRKTKCKKDCQRPDANRHKAEYARAERNEIVFIGVDGEGVDRPDGSHEYVMLSVGEHTLFQGGEELTLQSVLSFLYERFTENSSAAFVGFFLGYDFNHWLKHLPEDRARLLVTSAGIASRKTSRTSNPNPYPDPVVWDGWELDILAGRRIKLRPHTHHSSQYDPEHCRNRTCRAELQTPYDTDPVLVHGELEWEIPDDNGILFHGVAKNYWALFGPPKHAVGQKVKSKTYGWMYICDTGPFWQTSFLNVINPEAWEGVEPVATDAEYRLVVKGKADRGITAVPGDTSYFEEMRRYNVLENDLLSRVTDRLNKGFMNERIPIKVGRTDWYGPGRAAQLWMDQLHARCADPNAVESNRSVEVRADPRRRVNERGILSSDCFDSMPAWFREAAQSSYYGGWFEQFVHGHCGNCWEYDINSAYPFIIASLPCLHTTDGHNGKYSQGYGSCPSFPERQISLLYATVRGSNPYIGAMPHRDKYGRISRPLLTKGWYWSHEIEAAKRVGLVDSVEVEEWVSYSPCECGTPFNPGDIGIEALYQLRLDFGKGTPQGKSAKLVYNSAYGKTAQSIGQPKYANPVYASLITAGCRTLILNAIATHPSGASSVTMVATDGVYFRDRHPGLELSKTQLGLWDETFKPDLTQFMPGVYWDADTRNRISDGKSPKLKSRGVNARDLAKEISNLDVLFSHAYARLAEGKQVEWPTIKFTTGFLMESVKSALNRGKWNEAGKITHNAIRNISSDPTSKRFPIPYIDVDAIRTLPYPEMDRIESVPYDRTFGYISEDMSNLFGGGVTQDGEDPMQWFRDLMVGNV